MLCVQVTMEDFEAALKEVKPAFGAVTETLQEYILNGMIDYGPHFNHLHNTCRTLVDQVHFSCHALHSPSKNTCKIRYDGWTLGSLSL